MFRTRRLPDPFRLSVLGCVRVAFSWFKGPILLRRWMILVGAVALALGVTVGTSVGVILGQRVTHTASVPASTQRPSEPGVAAPIEVAGYECHPMQQAVRRPTLRSVPIVVVIDSSGVPYGPACLVTGGLAGQR